MILFSAIFAGIITYWLTHASYSKNQRTFHHPLIFVKHLKNDAHAGKKIYREYCAACHAPHPIIPVHAPIVGDQKAWVRYRKMGLKKLLVQVNQGKGAMPARGGCFECDDELLTKTLRYMLSYHLIQLKKK